MWLQVINVTDPVTFIFSQQQFHVLMSIPLVQLQRFFQLQVLIQTVVFVQAKNESALKLRTVITQWQAKTCAINCSTVQGESVKSKPSLVS